MSGRPSHIPPHWSWATITELTQFVTSGSRGWAKHYADTGPVFLRVGNLDHDTIAIDLADTVRVQPPVGAEGERTRVKDGDVLLSITAEVGMVGLVGPGLGEAYVNQHVALLRPAKGVWGRGLAYSFLDPQGMQAVARRAQYGATKPGLSLEQVRSFAVGVPPLKEQRRIVAALESYLSRLDDAVATLRRVQRNLKRYRASVLKAAVEGRLVPTEAELARAEGRSYEPASVLLNRIVTERRSQWDMAERTAIAPIVPDVSWLPSLPEGWCWSTLPQLGVLDRGKSRHRPRNDPRLLGGPYPFIQTADVRHADGFIETFESTYSDFGLSQSRLWPAGTLCITIAANIAETGILRFAACFPDSVVGWLNETEPTLTRFVELFMRTAKDELERYAPATAQKNINLEVLSELAVPVPPAAEQSRIIAEFDRLISVESDAVIACQQEERRIGRLRQSILTWAFKGKLVAQDPADEPASILLERIKSERTEAAAGENVKSRRRKRPHARAAKTS